VILGNEPRQDGQEDEKKNRPKEDRAAFEELNILVIVTLYVHGEEGSSRQAIRYAHSFLIIF
jgi:hypothetical protein